MRASSVTEKSESTKGTATYLVAALTGLCFAVAWLLPLTILGALLAGAGVLGLTFLSSRGALFALYGSALIAYLGAFHWLAPTMQKFSGLPAAASAIFFALFCAVSALQFPLFGIVTRFLRARGVIIFAPTLGWVTAQELFFRVFPWTPAHSLIAMPELAQIGYLVGATGCTALLFIGASILVEGRSRLWSPAAALGIFIALFTFGYFRLASESFEIKSPTAARLSVAMIQGNISVEQKHTRALANTNILSYLQASIRAGSATELDLVIWPETVVIEPTPLATKSLSGIALPQATLLAGALSYDENDQYYNSAWLVAPRSGTTSAPYHKQILMPFGEFTPGVELFPFLKQLNQNAAEFAAGTEQTLLSVPAAGGSFKLAPLICYEDVVPHLAHQAALDGADILVNMSNDGWFGVSAAAKQHHQIAAWRAIETGLPLLRATNTGFTAVVNPYGVTSAEVPEHAPQTLLAVVHKGPGPAKCGAAIADRFYALGSYILAGFIVISWLLQAIRRRPNRTK